MFIQEFQGLERELAHDRKGSTLPGGFTDQASQSLLSSQMREILRQIREEPFLVNLMPHLIKFVESKSQSMINSESPVAGDVPIYNLIIQVLQSIYANPFFDSDSQLKTVIPILMNITLCSKFNCFSSVRSITLLKDFNALLLSQFIEKFH